jgi:ABC-type nitrate/sulfonate/bicarbonate transport system permease component
VTARPRKSFYQKHESVILGGGVLLITLIIWQALWSAGKISPLFMSGPSAIAKRFWEDLLHGNLLKDLAYSGKNFAIGFLIAAVAGVVFGVIIGWYKRVEMITGPFTSAL